MPKFTVLVVDDDINWRKLLCDILQGEFPALTFMQAGNGKEALDQLKEGEVDIIFSDWEMPVMKGIELLRRIRKSKKYKDIPFVMQSGKKDDENMKRALNAGASGYIAKPCSTKKYSEFIMRSMDAPHS